VAVDFDGVVPRYDSPWIAPHVIPDPPVQGAIEWLHQTLQRFDVVIYSTRARTWRGRRAMRRYLREHAGEGLWFEAPGYRGLEDIRFSHGKPRALVYVDDRAFRFTGANFPTKDEIHALRPWNKESQR